MMKLMIKWMNDIFIFDKELEDKEKNLSSVYKSHICS